MRTPGLQRLLHAQLDPVPVDIEHAMEEAFDDLAASPVAALGWSCLHTGLGIAPCHQWIHVAFARQGQNGPRSGSVLVKS